MSGFSKDLTKKTYSGKLYHSCTIEGFLSLLNSGVSGELSCSTEESKKLFGREAVVVMNVKSENGNHAPFDADSGKYYGYDEFIISLNGFDDFRNKIEYIILSDRLFQIWESEDWDEDEEELEVLFELAEDNGMKFKTADSDFYNVN